MLLNFIKEINPLYLINLSLILHQTKYVKNLSEFHILLKISKVYLNHHIFKKLLKIIEYSFNRIFFY